MALSTEAEARIILFNPDSRVESLPVERNIGCPRIVILEELNPVQTALQSRWMIPEGHAGEDAIGGPGTRTKIFYCTQRWQAFEEEEDRLWSDRTSWSVSIPPELSRFLPLGPDIRGTWESPNSHRKPNYHATKRLPLLICDLTAIPSAYDHLSKISDVKLDPFIYRIPGLFQNSLDQLVHQFLPPPRGCLSGTSTSTSPSSPSSESESLPLVLYLIPQEVGLSVQSVCWKEKKKPKKEAKEVERFGLGTEGPTSLVDSLPTTNNLIAEARACP
ncbi:hypothetical protein BT96DRAFT_1006640 [Gymnopus androsaceus JB14]|uniref:Uncharacterized protein n=1 Tax=Gymnopus androsaceus JB14 TaxID=1447944 RepID=A0A6A4GJM2_9AGAR|nr:hypothetical protein BT96DRAFT_1006640 [Gymnopus androsaceus JB14]